MAQTLTPQFRITDARRSLAFYVDGLGFTVDWQHRFEPGAPVFMSLTRADQTIFLTEHGGDCKVGGAAYFVVADVDACHREFAGRGIRAGPPEDMPWGPREMVVTDPDGNRLRFASSNSPPAKTAAESKERRPVISVMLAVDDAPAAVAWYQRALGATELWNLGSVAGLEILGAPFFVGEPARNGWESPAKLGITSCRVEVFCADPDGVIARALLCGAESGRHQVRDHQMPWGSHRQGGFNDPFGHIWLVGDRSPLSPHPRA